MKTRVFAVYAVILLFCGIVNAGINDGLVAYYPFNGNANDESGNGHNGIVNGATLTADRFGTENKAYSFNGSNSYIVLNNTDKLNFTSTAFSLVAWVNLVNDNHTDELIVAKHICGSGSGYFLGASQNAISYFVGEDPRLMSSKIYNDGKWHFVAGIYDGAVQYLYVDGVLKGSQGRQTHPNDTNIQIGMGTGGGCSPGSGWFHGSVDDVRIYNRALSDSEVQQLYQSQGACSSELVKFTAGTPAKAADVNANFDAHNCQIQALKAIVCQDHPTASICQ